MLVLTGEQDQAFCGPGSPVLGLAECGSLLPDTQALFPNADYNWHSINATGHAINYHYSAQDAFRVAHQFWQGKGLRDNGNSITVRVAQTQRVQTTISRIHITYLLLFK